MKSTIFAIGATGVSAIQLANPVKLFSGPALEDFYKFGASLLQLTKDVPNPAQVPFANFVGASNNATFNEHMPGMEPLLPGEGPRPTLKQYAEFYHTSDELREELDKLKKTCPASAAFTIDNRESVSENGRKVDVQFVTLGNKNANHRVFMLAGEHAREFIAAESALHFLQSLCGQTDVNMNNLLEEVHFQVVVNANEASRRKAEEGHFCLRVNPSGVDLNRNWDTHWRQSKLKGTETWGGPAAFSEPETKIFRDLVKDFKPTAFLSIHSGTKAMFTPYAYAPKLPDFNANNMSAMLRELDTKYCECPFGPAGSELPYLSRGTCMDWVYENLELPYAFVFELWGPPEDNKRLKDRFGEDLKIHKETFQFHEAIEHDLGSDFHEKDEDKYSVAQMKSKFGHSECFHIFNPEEKEDYLQIKDAWTKLYRDLSERLQTAPSVFELNQKPKVHPQDYGLRMPVTVA